jgi:hypothetical protein
VGPLGPCRHWQRQWWQDLFDLRAHRFEERRQHELLAEMRGILVDAKARAFSCDLEQHAAGFLEVDRLEPEPIDHRRRPRAELFDLRAHGNRVLLVVHAPRKMMHGAAAPRAATLVRRLA